MVPKTKKEASALPKAEAKPKALESKESSGERHPQPHRNDLYITYLMRSQNTSTPKAA